MRFGARLRPSGLHQVDPSVVQRSERALGESAVRGVSRRVGGLVQARRRRPSEKGCQVLVRCRLRLRGGNAGTRRLARILEDCLISHVFFLKAECTWDSPKRMRKAFVRYVVIYKTLSLYMMNHRFYSLYLHKLLLLKAIAATFLFITNLNTLSRSQL